MDSISVSDCLFEYAMWYNVHKNNVDSVAKLDTVNVTRILCVFVCVCSNGFFSIFFSFFIPSQIGCVFFFFLLISVIHSLNRTLYFYHSFQKCYGWVCTWMQQVFLIWTKYRLNFIHCFALSDVTFRQQQKIENTNENLCVRFLIETGCDAPVLCGLYIQF